MDSGESPPHGSAIHDVEPPVGESQGVGQSAKEITAAARHAFLWLVSTSVVWQLLSWGLTLVTARVLSPNDYGIAALPGTVVPYLVLLANFKLDTWIVQVESWSEEREKAIFTLSLLTGIATTAGAFLLAGPLASFYQRPDLIRMFQACALMFLFQSIQLVPEAMLRRELRFKALSLINLFVNMSQGVLTLALACFGWGYWSLILGILYRQAVRAGLILCVKSLPSGFVWSPQIYREALQFGFSASVAAALAIISSTADEVVVGRFFGAEVLGFYSMAYFFSQIPVSKIQMVIGSLLMPYYSKLRNNGHDPTPAFMKFSRAIVVLAAPALVGLIVVADLAVSIILGDKWLAMVPALQVLCFVAVLQALTVTIPSFLYAYGRPNTVLGFHIFSAIVLPFAFVVGAKWSGVRGVYLAWLVAYPLVLYVTIRAFRTVVPIGIVRYLLNFRSSLLAATVMGVVVWEAKLDAASLHPYLRFAVAVACGCVVYPLALRVFYWGDTRELLALRREMQRA